MVRPFRSLHSHPTRRDSRAWVVLGGWRRPQRPTKTGPDFHPDRRRPATRSEELRLLDALRHLGHAHQWPGELVEKLIGVLLFAQGKLQ